MIEVEVTPIKIGNSIGVILPKEVIEHENIKVKEGISIIVRKNTAYGRKLFGILKGENKKEWMKALKEAKSGWDDM